MEYDRVKDRMEKVLGDQPLLKKLFFAALDRLFLRSRYIAREIRRLKKGDFSPDQILDAGSGFGQYSFRLGRAFPGAEVTGLDLKPEIVDSGNRLAKRSGRKNVRFEVGDLLDLKYESRFDLVLSVDVLEHIEEDRKVLANIAQALKPNGLFIFTTPYFDGSEPGEAVFVSEHVRPGYTRSEAQEKLSETGFELKQFTITYGRWGRVAWTLLQKWPMSTLSGRFWLLPLVLLYSMVVYPIAWTFMKLDMREHNRNGGGILAVAVRRKRRCNPP